MGTCFVMQPFDGGPFDSRYEDVLVPAIEAADLEPYRVDRDPGTVVPIEDIEGGIRRADACLADISTDNPNVWFELGFAIASRKPVVLVCSDQRSRFPFDVQHRAIIRYSCESPRDFEALKEKITPRLRAAVEKQESLGRLAHLAPIADVQGLAQHEMVALVAVAENLDNPGDRVAVHAIREDMVNAGFTRVAVTLALTELLRKGLVSDETVSDYDGDPYCLYSVTKTGMEWLLENQGRLALRKKPEPAPNPDDIPF